MKNISTRSEKQNRAVRIHCPKCGQQRTYDLFDQNCELVGVGFRICYKDLKIKDV